MKKKQTVTIEFEYDGTNPDRVSQRHGNPSTWAFRDLIKGSDLRVKVLEHPEPDRVGQWGVYFEGDLRVLEPVEQRIAIGQDEPSDNPLDAWKPFHTAPTDDTRIWAIDRDGHVGHCRASYYQARTKTRSNRYLFWKPLADTSSPSSCSQDERDQAMLEAVALVGPRK